MRTSTSSDGGYDVQNGDVFTCILGQIQDILGQF